MVDLSRILKFGSNKTSGTEYKNALLKKNILVHLAGNCEVTIADLAKELNISVPTATKLLQDLKDDGYLEDNGKIETAGGRRPNVLVSLLIFFILSGLIFVEGEWRLS